MPYRDCGAICLAILILLVSGCVPTEECNVSVQSVPSSNTVPISALKIISSEPLPTTFTYNHASTVVETPGGDLLVAWGAGSQELASDCLILLSRKARGAAAWTDPIVVADKPGYADANPVLFVDDAGLIWLFHVEMFGDTFCLGRVMSRTSSDNGVTWSEPRTALNAICTMVRNHPIITKDGRWILPAYQQAIYQSQFWISEDRGLSWNAGGTIFTPTANNLQPAVVQLSDGSLFALMRTAGGNNETWEGKSRDCGKTWQTRQRPELPNPNSGIDLIRLNDGQLFLVYNPNKLERTPISWAISGDEGVSWSLPHTIADGEPQLSYPSACQSSDGHIHVTYSDRLTRIQHVELSPD